MRSIVLALCIAGCLVAPGQDAGGPGVATLANDEADALGASVANGTVVVFETSFQAGEITMVFYDELLPLTTHHILSLVESGFYDGTKIHRVVDDFVIQGGDPSGTGQLGSGGSVPFESDPRLMFGAGAVGLARDVDPDSGDSQWFITEKPAPHLHDPQGTSGDVFGSYALFGQVIEGMDVVRAIAARPVIPGADAPIEDIRVVKASVGPWPDVDPRTVVTCYEEQNSDHGVAALQTPCYPVVGQATPMVLLVAQEPGDAEIEALLSDGDGITVTFPFLQSVDASTYDATIEIPHAGAWTLSVAGVEIDLQVLG